MRFTFKYRLYPTKAQSQFLEGQLREATDLYNAALQERRDAWRICRKSINYYAQANQLKAMRAEGLVGLVSFSSCQHVLRRLDQTFAAFFERCKRGEKPGYPRFKSWRRYNTITFPSPGHGYKLLPNNKLRIQGAGHIKIKLHRPIEGTIKTLTIQRDVDHWYAIFSVDERQPTILPTSADAVGVDVGLNSFVVLSDGTEIDNPKHLHYGLAHLRRCHRRLARRQKGSNRRRKAAVLVAKAHRKIRNQRAGFHHEVSRWLVNRPSGGNVEDLGLMRFPRSLQSLG